MSDPLTMRLDQIQPSQLYISQDKLRTAMTAGAESLEPVPVARLDGQIILTDGHTRALAALLVGRCDIRVRWETDDLDWEAYRVCVRWCRQEGILTVSDLKQRIVGAQEYETLWHERCRHMHAELAARRARSATS
jgi:hypothetical protein